MTRLKAAARETKGAFGCPYSGIGIHGIEVRNPSFLRISLSSLLLQNARPTVLNHHFTYSHSGIGSVGHALI